jgi:hypothetical protein
MHGAKRARSKRRAEKLAELSNENNDGRGSAEEAREGPGGAKAS